MSNTENAPAATPDRRWRNAVWLLAGTLLLLPLIAMQFTSEVNWGLEDFLAAAVLLGVSAGVFELAMGRQRSGAYKRGVALAVGGALVMMWVNLAVGIIGDEGNPANLMYVGIVGVVLLGAAVSRLRPRGMMMTMLAAAGAQVLAFVVALAAGWGFTLPITVVFLAIWIGSAQLFREAARIENDAD